MGMKRQQVQALGDRMSQLDIAMQQVATGQ